MNDLIETVIDEEEDPGTAEGDGRATLVQTILNFSARVREKHDVRLFLEVGTQSLDEEASLMGLDLWLLAEFLCILIILDESESVQRRQVHKLRRKVPYPIPFIRDGQRRCLWVQHPMRGMKSGFLWIPDLAITEDTEVPSSENVLEIVECKRHAKLNSSTVRSEFAKSYDLEVPAYLLWSYFEVSDHVRKGAESLGLLLRTIGLMGPQREHLRDPNALARRISEGMRETREARPFAAALEQRAAAAVDKSDRDRRLP
jgi:hypothetical protein